MTNAMSSNNVGFAELTRDEMLSVDGGGGLGDVLVKVAKVVITEVAKSAAVDAVKAAAQNVTNYYANAYKNGSYDNYDAYVGP